MQWEKSILWHLPSALSKLQICLNFSLLLGFTKVHGFSGKTAHHVMKRNIFSQILFWLFRFFTQKLLMSRLLKSVLVQYAVSLPTFLAYWQFNPKIVQNPKSSSRLQEIITRKHSIPPLLNWNQSKIFSLNQDLFTPDYIQHKIVAFFAHKWSRSKLCSLQLFESKPNQI